MHPCVYLINFCNNFSIFSKVSSDIVDIYFVYTSEDVFVSISAINSNSYTNLMQYRYFDTSISNNQILSLMQQYGISPSGDKASDLEALYEAMYSDAKNIIASNVNKAQQAQQDKTQNSQPTPLDVPWASLMTQAGLHVSGDYKKDYQEFNDKIFQMKLSAASPKDYAMISQFVSQADIVFIRPSDSSEASSPLPSATGADITAMLNRLYFLG